MRRLTTTTLTALALAGLLAGGALAQMPQGMQPQQPSQEQMRLQQIQQRLGQIQQAALEAHPELQEQNADLEELVVETMQEAGYQPEAKMDTLQALRERIQSPDLSQAEQQQMMMTAQEAQQHLQEAQQVAMQDSQVVAAQEAFRDDLIAAMNEQDPETEDLIAEFEQIQRDLRGGMPGMAPGGPAPPGGGGR
jgi:chromosome segregation ATPase